MGETKYCTSCCDVFGYSRSRPDLTYTVCSYIFGYVGTYATGEKIPVGCHRVTSCTLSAAGVFIL